MYMDLLLCTNKAQLHIIYCFYQSSNYKINKNISVKAGEMAQHGRTFTASLMTWIQSQESYGRGREPILKLVLYHLYMVVHVSSITCTRWPICQLSHVHSDPCAHFHMYMVAHMSSITCTQWPTCPLSYVPQWHICPVSHVHGGPCILPQIKKCNWNALKIYVSVHWILHQGWRC